ncbi:MAG: DUF424 domain-containing protein [Candidatus Thorarchaeota archaeon]
MQVYLNQMRREGEYIVAICDQNILGQSFEEGDRCIHINERFYKGKLVSVEEGLAAMGKATIANIVGENIVNEALKAQLIHERGVIRIQNVPHAQVVVTK